jgi:hypothetical protein
MDAAVLKEIGQLRGMTVNGLREKYREIFGEDSRSGNKDHLFRRIAWRLQASAEGDLSERARRRALEIANDADLRAAAPKTLPCSDASSRTTVTAINGARDSRLPKAGTLLTREFKGKMYVVKVLEDGFEFESQTYHSLSKIATEIAGTRWNGYTFFALDREARVA